MDHADFPKLKIWDLSVDWLKSYGQKVALDATKLCGYNFELGKVCMVGGLLQLNPCVNCQGLHLSLHAIIELIAF